MKKIAIYGFGGLGREIACLIKHQNQQARSWNLIGFFDDHVTRGTSCDCGVVLGGLNELNAYGDDLCVVIAIASTEIVHRLVSAITNPRVSYPNLIAGDVLFFDKPGLRLGKGNIIGFSCRISCDVEIGDFNILNGSVSLGHDVKIGSYNLFFPDTRLSGGVKVGNFNFFGARSFVYQYVEIGTGVKVSAGSFLAKSTKDNCIYAGNPARSL